MTQKKISNFFLNLETVISFPFIAIFYTLVVMPFILLVLLYEDKDSEYKKEFLDKSGTPKRYFVTLWRITKDMTKDDNDEMQEGWKVLLGIAIVTVVIPIILAIIWC